VQSHNLSSAPLKIKDIVKVLREGKKISEQRILLKLYALQSRPEICGNCQNYFCVNQSGVCAPQHPKDAVTSYDFLKRKRVFSCCQAVLNFGSDLSKNGCICEPHHVKTSSSSEFRLLYPAHYQVIREEGVSEPRNDLVFMH
jgi:hypothetical protein